MNKIKKTILFLACFIIWVLLSYLISNIIEYKAIDEVSKQQIEELKQIIEKEQAWEKKLQKFRDQRIVNKEELEMLTDKIKLTKQYILWDEMMIRCQRASLSMQEEGDCEDPDVFNKYDLSKKTVSAPKVVENTQTKAPSTGLFSVLWTNAEKAEFAYNLGLAKWFNHEQSLRLVAQLHRENGRWDVNVRGDGGCSVGLSQWNECARGPLPVGYSDWKGQITLLADEVERRYNESNNFQRAQVGWNNPRAYGNGQYKTVYYYDIHKTFISLFG